MAPSASTDLPVRNGTNGTHANGGTSSYASRFNLAPHFIGGNHLEAAPSSKVKDFVTNHDGHTVITNVCFSFTASSISGKTERARS